MVHSMTVRLDPAGTSHADSRFSQNKPTTESHVSLAPSLLLRCAAAAAAAPGGAILGLPQMLNQSDLTICTTQSAPRRPGRPYAEPVSHRAFCTRR